MACWNMPYRLACDVPCHTLQQTELTRAQGEKGIGDGTCSYGLKDGDDILMKQWEGTILGASNVRRPALSTA